MGDRKVKDNPRTVFVYNIPDSMHWKGLWVLFQFHGNVLDAFILAKRSMKGKRFGFVRFTKPVDAQREISRLDGGMEYQEEEREESNVNVLNGRLKSVEVERIGMNKIKVVEGHGRYFLIEVPDDELLEILKQKDWAYVKEFFINIEPWSEKFKATERAAWIEVLGVPLHCWKYQTFKRVAGLWGEIIAIGDNLTMVNNFENMDILILIKQAYKLEEVRMLEVGNDIFPIRIKERSLVEETKEKQKKSGEQMVREEDASSEVGSTNKSKMELSPEGRRNDGDEGFIVPCLENEGNKKGEQGLSTEAFNGE
ncbi:hypothetical protein Gogos_011388 [Gossypium gossypioides]|uniref:RRM domain-containing protein n=1 Tax=Gossypium gossypioides TaxID=34282 RepID=A0A7J9BP46_GOSGO|nr:hypothetical protein [Gossypium gossypioides]